MTIADEAVGDLRHIYSRGSFAAEARIAPTSSWFVRSRVVRNWVTGTIGTSAIVVGPVVGEGATSDPGGEGSPGVTAAVEPGVDTVAAPDGLTAI